MAVDEARTEPARTALVESARAPAAQLATRLSRIHAAVWLAGIVVLSAAYRIAAARATAAPAIFPDELIYTDLARSLADSGSFSVGGARFSPWSFGPLYPVLIAPVFALAHDTTTAYAAVKIVDSVVVSLAAIPAYLLARRVLPGRRAALLFAAVALLVPALIYSTKVMTESLAYPVFLAVTVAMQRGLERPSGSRHLRVLALLGVAVLARAQMVVLLPAYATALGAAELLTPGRRKPTLADLGSVLRRHRLAWSSLAGVAVATAAVAAAESSAVLGSHTALGSRLDLLAAPKQLLFHLAELDLAAGVIPLLALVLLAGSLRRLSRPLSAFVVMTASVGVWLLALAAVYATQEPQARIYERYVFYLVPLLVLALFAWISAGLPRPRAWKGAAGLVVVLPLSIPFADVLVGRQWGVNTATVALVPWGLARVAFDSLAPVYVGTGILLAGFATLVLRARPETAGRLRVVVAGYFVVVGLVVHAANLALANRSARLGVASTDPSWIDRVVGENGRVAAVWTGTRRSGWRSGYGVWENSFYNRSVTTVYTLRGEFPGHWASTRLRLEGTLATAGGRPVRPAYVLADPTARISGTVLARDRRTGMTLYRVRGPLRLRLVGSGARNEQA